MLKENLKTVTINSTLFQKALLGMLFLILFFLNLNLLLQLCFTRSIIRFISLLVRTYFVFA